LQPHGIHDFGDGSGFLQNAFQNVLVGIGCILNGPQNLSIALHKFTDAVAGYGILPHQEHDSLGVLVASLGEIQLVQLKLTKSAGVHGAFAFTAGVLQLMPSIPQCSAGRAQ